MLLTSRIRSTGRMSPTYERATKRREELPCKLRENSAARDVTNTQQPAPNPPSPELRQITDDELVRLRGLLAAVPALETQFSGFAKLVERLYDDLVTQKCAKRLSWKEMARYLSEWGHPVTTHAVLSAGESAQKACSSAATWTGQAPRSSCRTRFVRSQYRAAGSTASARTRPDSGRWRRCDRSTGICDSGADAHPDVELREHRIA